MSRRVRVLVSGRVQGVGFRYATQAEALEAGLRGWVRNLPDGRVEAEFEGSPEAVGRMVAWCENGPRWALVEKVEVILSEETGGSGPTGFHVRG